MNGSSILKVTATTVLLCPCSCHNCIHWMKVATFLLLDFQLQPAYCRRKEAFKREKEEECASKCQNINSFFKMLNIKLGLALSVGVQAKTNKRKVRVGTKARVKDAFIGNHFFMQNKRINNESN